MPRPGLSRPVPEPSLELLAERFQPLLRRLNLHRFLWLFTLVCALIAWNRGLALLWAMVACLLAALLLSWALGTLALRGIGARREIPAHAEAGQSAALRYHLHGADSRRHHFLSLHEPALVHVQQDGAPAGPTLADGPPLAFVPCLQGTASVDAWTPPLVRGIHPLGALAVSSAWPLGLLNRVRMLDLPAQELVVLPAMHEVSHLPFSIATGHGGQSLPSRQAGVTEDFAGVREYRRGDALKTLHWSGTARQVARGQPWLVKTYEQHDEPRVLIVLNPWLPAGAAFEAMASLAASLARHASWQGWPVVLFGWGAGDGEGHGKSDRKSEGKNDRKNDGEGDGEGTTHAPKSYWQQAVAPHSPHWAEELRCLAALRPQRRAAPLSYADVIDAALHEHPHSSLCIGFGDSPAPQGDARRQHLYFQLTRGPLALRTGAQHLELQADPKAHSVPEMLALLHNAPV